MRCSADRQHERSPSRGVRTTHGGCALLVPRASLPCGFLGPSWSSPREQRGWHTRERRAALGSRALTNSSCAVPAAARPSVQNVGPLRGPRCSCAGCWVALTVRSSPERCGAVTSPPLSLGRARRVGARVCVREGIQGLVGPKGWEQSPRRSGRKSSGGAELGVSLLGPQPKATPWARPACP